MPTLSQSRSSWCLPDDVVYQVRPAVIQQSHIIYRRLHTCVVLSLLVCIFFFAVLVLHLRSPKDDLIISWQNIIHVTSYISPLRGSRKGKKALKSHKFDISRRETSTFSFFKVGINIDNISTSHHGTFECGEKKGILLRIEAPVLTSAFSV